jgi:hypothetical protein
MENRDKFPVDFLANWGLRLEDLPRFVRPLATSEVLLLVGSCAEGLATPLSDINLLLIGDAPTSTDAVIDSSTAPSTHARATKPAINIESHEFSKIGPIIDKLAAGSTLIRNPSQVEGVVTDKFDMLNSAEIGLLHSIRTGVALVNSATVESWRERIEDLPDFLTLFCLVNHFNSREDLIGQVKYGDPLSALWMLSNATNFLAGAMLASVGETNPYQRWRPLLLKCHEELLGKERVERVLQFLLPTTVPANMVAMAQHALSSFDLTLLEIFGRRQTLTTPLREFRKRARYVVRFDELANLQASSMQGGGN